MSFLNYVVENALILIPVIYLIGSVLKDTEKISDKYIPIILLPIGILLSCGVMKGFTVDAIIQGVLVVGASVYSNQVAKQLEIR